MDRLDCSQAASLDTRPRAVSRMSRLCTGGQPVGSQAQRIDPCEEQQRRIQGGSLYSAVHPGAGPEQSREPAMPIRTRRCRAATWLSRDRSHRRGSRPFRQRLGGTARLRTAGAGLCGGEVGAVLCFDASRLARSGRDWHHLLELCGLVQARVIDLDGVYGRVGRMRAFLGLRDRPRSRVNGCQPISSAVPPQLYQRLGSNIGPLFNCSTRMSIPSARCCK
jgi:hypothetical protein